MFPPAVTKLFFAQHALAFGNLVSNTLQGMFPVPMCCGQ